MKHLISLILFLSVTNSFAAENNFLRFVCQKYYALSGEPSNNVVIVEQTSVKRFNSKKNGVVDGSDLINPKGKNYTGQTEFRMRIFNDVSLVSDDKTKEEIIKELLKKQANRDIDGDLMDFKGIGYRLGSGFAFDSKFNSEGVPYNKTLLIKFNDLSDGEMVTDNAASTMFEDGLYRCEEPVLIPVEAE